MVICCVIITNIWWDISNSYITLGQFVFLWIFQKNCIDNISRKSRRDSSPSPLLIRYNTHTPWRTTSNIQTNEDHHHFFIQYESCVHAHVLVHSIDKTHALVVTREFIWFLFLNILSFNFVPTLNKYLRFTRFRRSYVNHPYVALIKVTLIFCFLFKVTTFHFLSCLSPMMVHLHKLFLLSTPFARISLTLRWLSRQKDVK